MRCAPARGAYRRQSSRVGTCRTEFRRAGELVATVSTCPCQGHAAFLAELCADLVLVLAPRTWHGEPRPPSGCGVRLTARHQARWRDALFVPWSASIHLLDTENKDIATCFLSVRKNFC